MSRDDEVWDQVSRLLGSRPGWKFEPSTTPGGPPSWCLLAGGEVECSVSVIDGSLSVYVPASDRDIVFSDIEALTVWIEGNEAMPSKSSGFSDQGAQDA